MKNLRLQIMKQFFFHDEFLQSVRLPAKYDYDIYDQDFAKNERICANVIFMILIYDCEQFN